DEAEDPALGQGEADIIKSKLPTGAHTQAFDGDQEATSWRLEMMTPVFCSWARIRTAPVATTPGWRSIVSAFWDCPADGAGSTRQLSEDQSYTSTPFTGGWNPAGDGLAEA